MSEYQLSVDVPRHAFRPSPVFVGVLALVAVSGWMTWAGFGNPSPGLWLSPHVERAAEVTRGLLHNAKAEPKTTVIAPAKKRASEIRSDSAAGSWTAAST